MIKLSKLTDYASVLLAVMARHPHMRWAAHELAEQTKVPKPTCVKVLKLLTRAGLLVSAQGAQGGYALARPASEIPVKAIIEAIEGRLAITECGTDEQLCKMTDHCSIMSRWRELGDRVNAMLTEVSLADLVSQTQLQDRSHDRIAARQIV